MPDREKVIDGLCGAIGLIHGYIPKSLWADGYEEQACRDAIALLKEPKPHLLTVEELDALPVGSVVWEEYLDMEWEITELEPAMKSDSATLMAESGYTTIMEGMRDPDVDGNCWRWWSAKPTAEQRKAAKWE